MSVAKPSVDPSASEPILRGQSPGSAGGSRLALLYWGGVILAIAVIPIFLAQVFVAKRLITPWYLPIGGTVGAIGVLYAASRGWRWWRIGIATLCIAIACLEWFFLLSATRLPAYQGPIAAGSTMPAFHATLADGTSIDESYFRQNHDTVLVFFQGRWCPFCMTQLTDLESHYAEFNRVGAAVVVISIEDQDMAAQTQSDFPHLTVVSDKQRELSTAIDLINKGFSPDGGDSAAPTVLLLDGEGKVRWLHRPTRFIARPSAKELVANIESK